MIIPGALMGVTDYVYVAGVAADPDSITAVLYRWVGATRSASGITVTVTSVGTGEYRFTWTVDGGFARTDELELVALPVVSGVTYPATVWRSHGAVDAVVPTVAAGAIGGLLTAPTTANTGLADVTRLLGTAWLTPGTAGTPDVNLTTTALGSIWNRLTSSLTVAGSIGKHLVDYLTGDIFARIGATGSGLTSLAPSATALSTAQWTNTLATNLGTTNSTVATNLDVAISVIQAQIAALNNLSAKANWFGSALLEVPDSSTRSYIYELVVRDDEDKLANLDGLPTIALVNAAGTDRSALITTTVANPSTGRYTITITVGTATDNESLKLTATGAISGEARYAVMGLQVVDYDNATQVALILTRIGTPVVSVSADIATAQTDLDTLTAGVNVTQVDGSNLDTHSIGNFPADVRDWNGLSPTLAIDIDNSAPSVAVSHIHADAISADSVSAAAVTKIQSGLSTHSAADVITLLGSGTQIFGHSYLESIKRIEVKSGSKLSGAGSGTEVQTSVDTVKTVTWTVDGSGNITDEVWA